MTTIRYTLLALAAIAACSGEHGQTVLLRLPAGPLPELAAIRFEPESALRAARAGVNGWLAIERVGPLTVHIPGMCPVRIPANAGAREIEIRPLLDLGPDRAQIGFDSAFEIEVHSGCVEGERGAISWAQIEGPPLAELALSRAGRQLRARTLPLAKLLSGALPHGVVPFSPRTQGRYVLEATWSDQAGATLRRSVAITSIARATGVPSIAVSQQVMLGGAGWHVREAARGGTAQALAGPEYSLFTPDAPGHWVLEDAAGGALQLQAAWHNTTPIDCGRAECHASAAQAATRSPMSHALERHFDRCALDCHVVGERGLRDGGFLDVAADLDWRWRTEAQWHELPQALRRLGGVRCTSCHGPGAIPEAGARAKILQADVCANCHDAPPRYAQVEQWRASRMSRSDDRADTREADCARCHTTGGFLEAVGVRARDPDRAPHGIACAACHAPHAERHTGALLRAELPNLCASCHAPLENTLTPAASAATIVSGTARVPHASESNSWQVISAPAPHAEVQAGCIGCHGSGGKGGKLDHSFRSNPAQCASCHKTDPRPDQGLHTRALELERRLKQLCGLPARGETPPHAQPTAAAACPSPALTRANYAVSLLVEDPAAAIHNAALARQLLADAEAQLAN